MMIPTPEGKILVGIDEVGYGCLAGEVMVCAAYIPPEHEALVRDQGFTDSKKLSKARRTKLVDWAHANPGKIRWGLSVRDAAAIDRYGPVDARNMAALTALIVLERQLGIPLSQFHVIMDGTMELPGMPAGTTQQALPKADALVLPVSVASVIAKVTRDQRMEQIHETYPAYGFDSNAGYGTAQHLDVLYELGPLPGVHRRAYVLTAIQNYVTKHRKPLPAWVGKHLEGTHGT